MYKLECRQSRFDRFHRCCQIRYAFNSTLDRLNGQVEGISFTPTDIIAMLQLCSYETDALGYSAFCRLFTEEDFKNYEYYFDVSRWSLLPTDN